MATKKNIYKKSMGFGAVLLMIFSSSFVLFSSANMNTRTVTLGDHQDTPIQVRPICTVTYYFNSYYPASGWNNNPGYMVDGNQYTFASTTIDNQIEMLDGNTCPGTELGQITKVEIRTYGCCGPLNDSADILLTPFFPIKGSRNTYVYDCIDACGWSPWFDITNDSSAPTWSFSVVHDFDCQVKASSSSDFILYCSIVVVRVQYIPGI